MEVKNHRFSARVEASYIIDSDVKEGQKLKVRIFAIKKYAVNFADYYTDDDDDITSNDNENAESTGEGIRKT